MSDKKVNKVIDEEPVEELIWGFVKGLYNLHGVDLDPTEEVTRLEDCKVIKRSKVSF